MTPPITPPAAPMSTADTEAHEAGSYVRRTVTPTQDSPIPPTAPAARRRFIALRGW